MTFLVLVAGCGQGVRVDEVRVTVSPLTGRQGETLTLFVEGTGTSFAPADPGIPGAIADPEVTLVGEGAGVVLGQVIVDNEHRARVVAYVGTSAPITGDDGSGTRTVAVTSGDRIWEFDFVVTGAPMLPRIHVEPDSGLAGTTGMLVDVQALGETMTFDEDTVVTFSEDSGVHVDSLELDGPSRARVVVSIDDDGVAGTHPVTVTAGGDVATHPFDVHSPQSTRLWVFPDEGSRGESLFLTLVVEGMTLEPEDMQLTFPFLPAGDIVVEEMTWSTASTASAHVTVDENAHQGHAQIVLSSGGVEASGWFRILPTAELDPFLTISPPVVEQGANLRDIYIRGVYTALSVIDSELSIEPSEGITVNGFWVTEPDQTAVCRVTLDADADLGPHDISIVTGDETASAVLTVVEPPTLVVRADPREAEQGRSDLLVEIEVEGGDLLADSWEITFDDRAGIVIDDVTTTASTTANILLDVSPTAPTGPTLMTLELDGQVATAPFIVLPATDAASFTIQPPYISVPSGEVSVELIGTGTNWVSGEHQLYFSDPSIEVIDFVVEDLTVARAVVVGPGWLSARRVVVYVASTDEISGAWWTTLPTGYRHLSFYPDTVESSTSTTVIAVGDQTSFLDGLTMSLTAPGTGVRSGSVAVYDPDLALIQIETSSDTPPGIYGLTLSTGGEVALGTLTVEAAAAPPTVSADVGSIVPVTTIPLTLDGVDTSFDATTTVAVAAPGLTGLVPGVPTVIGPEEIQVDLYGYETLVDTTVPLQIVTDLEIVRTCIAVVESADDPYAHFTPTAVLPSSQHTLEVISLGTTPVDFLSDPPTAVPESSGVMVLESRVIDETTLEVDVDVGDETVVTGSVIEVKISGLGYSWTLVIPVLETPISLQVSGSPALHAGTENGTLDVVGHGFSLAGPSLRAVSPASSLFVSGASSTGVGTAQIQFDSAIEESASSPTLYVLPRVSPWAMPVVLGLAEAPVHVVGVPSSVMETVPVDEADIVGFTPAASTSLALWTLLDGDVRSAPWELIGADGISLLGRMDGDGIVAIADALPERYYARVGDASVAASSYWMSVSNTLDGADRFEAEPNDTIAEARGLSAPGSADALLLASIDCGCDLDYYQIPNDVDLCFEHLSTRWNGATLTSPFLSLTLLDATGAELDAVTGSVEHMDPVICHEGGGEGRYLLVQGLAGTTGSYLLAVRVSLLVTELDHTPGSGPWVEIGGPVGFDLTGYVLEIVDGSSGATRGIVDLSPIGSIPDDGHVVVSSPSTVPASDLEDAVLDQMAPPYAVTVCNSTSGSCDSVQVGGSGLYGEGTAIDPSSVPSGRIWSVDTDSNSSDFTTMVAATPGSPGGLPVP